MQGPNVKKLIAHKISLLAIPDGGGFAAGIEALTMPGRLTEFARQATDWVRAAIAAVKSARDNPFGNDDEAIAGEILRQVELKKKSR